MRYVEKLTARELECLLHAAHGCSAQETAAVLSISPHTVKKYRSLILQKLGCQNMTSALMVAMRMGWIASRAPENRYL